MKKSVKFLAIILIVLIVVVILTMSFTPKKNVDFVNIMKNDLQTLTSMPRPIGSSGEEMASNFIKEKFEKMGYEVSVQQYKNEEEKIGNNVVAIKKAKKDDANILIISAHHDSVATSYGANDNASGVVTLLAVADSLKNVSSDIELRFISFTDEENGKGGSRYYTNLLSENEANRILGNIDIDMLGGKGTSGFSICTMDGKTNWLTDLFLEKNSDLKIDTETASDHSSFQLISVPAVLLTQKDRGYFYHSVMDTADYIDLTELENARKIVVDVVNEIISKDSSYIENIMQGKENFVYTQNYENIIYFGVSLSESEAYIGKKGMLVDTYIESGEWWTDTYETYLYSMKWFNGNKPMNTYYIYRNGYFERIEIKPEETGYTADEVNKLICGMYGEPTTSYESEEGDISQSWEDTIYNKYISFDYSPFLVTINSYSAGIGNALATYPVVSGDAIIENEKYASVWNYICNIISQELRLKIAEFNIFTDGHSNILAYAATMNDASGEVDNTRFSINIDYYDVFDENGNKLDWSKLTYTILHEYGHIVLEDETQINLSSGEDIHDVNTFVGGSFRERFYNQFWKDIGTVGFDDYVQNPNNYVTEYSSNYFHEDIADTFALFVLGDKPLGTTVAENKILFFWNDSDMVELRNELRKNI